MRTSLFFTAAILFVFAIFEITSARSLESSRNKRRLRGHFMHVLGKRTDLEDNDNYGGDTYDQFSDIYTDDRGVPTSEVFQYLLENPDLLFIFLSTVVDADGNGLVTSEELTPLDRIK